MRRTHVLVIYYLIFHGDSLFHRHIPSSIGSHEVRHTTSHDAPSLLPLLKFSLPPGRLLVVTGASVGLSDESSSDISRLITCLKIGDTTQAVDTENYMYYYVYANLFDSIFYMRDRLWLSAKPRVGSGGRGDGRPMDGGIRHGSSCA